MAIVINIARDLHRLSATLDDYAKRQLPFAAARALTQAAQAARDDLRTAMGRAFDKPTRWSLNSTYVEPAKKGALSANVHFKDRLERGVPAGRFLAPQILGGARHMKSHERQLAAAGFLPAGMRLVPSKHAPTDAAGNMRASVLAQIIAALGAGAITARAGARLGAPSASRTFFAIMPGARQRGGLPPAIYMAKGTGRSRVVLPMLIYTGGASYSPRYDFDAIAMRAYETHLPRLLGDAMEHALRTARR